MAWAVKLKVSTRDYEKVFEAGKNKVTSIKINPDDGIIEIAHDAKAEYDHTIIPFNTIKSLKYKAEEHAATKHIETLGL